MSISVECLYHEGDPGHDDEWLPDMATLEVDGPYPAAGSDAWRHIWGKAYDLSNARRTRHARGPDFRRWAHDDCLRRTIAALDAGRSVVVANTFTRRWEMQPYLKAAKKRGINVRIVEATGSWPNVHGVPADAIERMRARWEHIEGEQQ